MPLTKEEIDLKMAELQENGKNQRWAATLGLVGNFLNVLLGCINAGLLINNRSVEKTNHAETVEKVAQVYSDTPSYNQVKAVESKIDANLLQWKAAKSQSPLDEAKAAEALQKVESME